MEAALSIAQRLPFGGRLLKAGSLMQRLKASPLFSQFDDESLAAITSAAEVVSLPGGRHLFHQGDASDDLYLVARVAAA